MKANELMIGDWVKLKDGGPLQMEDVSGTGMFKKWTSDGEYMIPYSYDEIEPIPLTPEILEKNGFIKDKDKKTIGTTYHILIPTGYEANSYTIQITLYKEPICGVSVLLKIWGWIPPYQGGINDIHLCGAKYVHELQHALRLCKIEKEIVL